MSSEFDLIRRYFTRPARRAVLGIGDDCTLYRPAPGMVQALSTDMLVEGRHFFKGADAEKLGRKSMAVNLSDLAAMGATPRFALLSVALPRVDEAWIAAFASGFFAMAEAHGVELVGGDTTRGPLTLCVTIIGEVPEEQALRRDAARVGDDLWLSGSTGAAALALAHREGEARLTSEMLRACETRLDDPVPRVALGVRLRGVARAAIDISDGLMADVGHIAERSSVGIEVECNALPLDAALRGCDDAALRLRCVTAGGDDYELAFTAAPEHAVAIEKIGADLGIPLTRIGRVVAGAGRAALLDEAGQEVILARTGYDHFAAPAAVSSGI